MQSPSTSSTTIVAAGPGSPSGASDTRKRKHANDDDTTAAGGRRFRASRACQYCRARKVRCDVLRNETGCTNCRLDGQECVLLASRRGKLDRWHEGGSTNGDSEPARRHDPEHTRTSRENSPAHNDNFTPETIPSALETDTAGNVPLYVTFDGNNEDIDPDQQTADNLSGSTTDYSPSDAFTHVSRNSISMAVQAHCSLSVPPALPSFIAPLPTRIPPEDLEFLARKGAFTVPEPASRIEILKAYIFSVYPFMPMLHLKPFAEGVVTERTDTPISLLLFQAVMFAGLSSLEPHNIRRLGFENAKQARDAYYTRVKLLFEFEVESDSTNLVQSLLLMSSWLNKYNQWKDTSHWTAQAFLVAQNMGLHREPTLACGSKRVRGLRRRMWWSLFIRDRMLALGTRRPMRIRDDDFDVSMLSIEDFEFEPLFGHDVPGVLDEDEQKCTALMCIEMAKLSVYIGHVLATQYTTLSTMPAVSHTTMVVPRLNGKGVHELEKCDAEIEEWFKQLSSNIQRPSTQPAQVGSTSCSEVHWAMLNLAHLTSVVALHRTQALKPVSDIREAHSVRTASKLKVKNAARKITKIAQAMLHRDQVRFLGLSGITALLAACLSHMGDTRTEDEDVRDASIFRFDQSMQVLQVMRSMYATADAAVSFLMSVAKKARLPLSTQATQSGPFSMPAPATHFAYPWTSTAEQSGMRENTGYKDSSSETTLKPFEEGLQLVAQAGTGPAAPLGPYQPPRVHIDAEPTQGMYGVSKEGSAKNYRTFHFDDLISSNEYSSFTDGQLETGEFELGFDTYDFLDNLQFLDGQPQIM